MHPFISHHIAEARSRDFRAAADHSRLVAACQRPPAPPRRNVLRRLRQGIRLVATGVRLSRTLPVLVAP